MILVTMCNNKCFNLINILLKISNIWNNKVNTKHFFFWKA